MSAPSHHPLSVSTVLLLLVPPLMWAGNAVVGRMAAPWIPPITFNLLRWVLAFVILLPLAAWVLQRHSPLWREWRRFGLLGLLAIAGYNMLQYLALNTSTPINVTLMAASMPVWMLLVGRLFFHAPVHRQALMGAGLSLTGVLVVLSQGELARLQQLALVPGDAWMLLAALVWACYSWLLTRRDESPDIRNDWAAFLLAQVTMGLVSASVLTGGEWWWLTSQAGPGDGPFIEWSWSLVAILVFVALGPSLAAYRCWSAGVQRAGPTVAGFFSNLTPLFAALMSAGFLGEPPKLFHGVAFALIVAGIVVSSWRR
jgi:drug/metabolite transporter (DMT)-like permease